MSKATPFIPGRAHGPVVHGGDKAAADRIVVLRADEIAQLARRPAGLVVVDPAPLSHAMIRLLRWGVPTLALRAHEAAMLAEDEPLTLDGGTGWLGPPDEAPPAEPVPPPPRAAHPVLTRDGQAVALRASVGDADAAGAARANGAEAVGLVRSELLTPADGAQPDAAFYEDRFGAICRVADPLMVTVRLLDLAADKLPPWLEPTDDMSRPLALQGVRLFDHAPVRDVFHAQVDALGALVSRWPVSLLVPYVTCPEEFQRWHDIIEARLAVPVGIGVMAETPAAALEMAEWRWLAGEVAIGCNDLMQCLFAADRGIPAIASLLDPCAPVLFRFLHEVADAAGDAVGAVQVCGLLPQMPGIMPVMLGLGFRTFSVEPVMIPYLARTVTATDTAAAQGLAAAVRAARDAIDVRTALGLPARAPWGMRTGP